MNKALMEQLELEKRKREILKEAQNTKKEAVLKDNLTERKPSLRSLNQFDCEDVYEAESSRKFAWEYELERYRKDKSRDRFYLFGAVCGILALILTLYFNASQWLQWLWKF